MNVLKRFIPDPLLFWFPGRKMSISRSWGCWQRLLQKYSGLMFISLSQIHRPAAVSQPKPSQHLNSWHVRYKTISYPGLTTVSPEQSRALGNTTGTHLGCASCLSNPLNSIAIETGPKLLDWDRCIKGVSPLLLFLCLPKSLINKCKKEREIYAWIIKGAHGLETR